MDMFKNNKYNFSALMLYMCYFLHGIQSIIISQNAAYFATKWSIPESAVFDVIAWTGIGKIVFLVFSGPLADKIGRKPVAFIGVLGYVLMFGGFLFADSIKTANILSFLGGAATSLFDGACNPAVLEIYPNHKSTASILNKGTLSIASALYPLLIGYLVTSGRSQSIGIWIPFILSALLLVAFFFIRLPDDDIKREEGVSAAEAVKILEERQAEESVSISKVNEPSRRIEGILIPLFGLTIYSTFYLFQQVSSIYAADVVGMTEVASRAVATYYQVGSFVAVLLSSVFMSKGIKDIQLLIAYPLAAAVAALVVYLMPNSFTLSVGAFVIGFAAAGGALQMGNSLFNQFFDTNKGQNTSIYYFVMSLGSYIMPKLAEHLRATNFTLVMLMVAVMAFLSFLIMAYIGKRYKYVFGEDA